MNVPILIDGQETGKLEICREGNYTLFRGRCADPGRLLRLSVYGGEKEGYIGVMMPEGGVVTVTKRCSRYELRNYPETIEYAGEAGQPPKKRETEPSPEQNALPEPLPPEEPPEREENVLPESGEESAEPPGDGELVWYETGDGSLYTRWEGRCFVAVPCSLGVPSEKILERRCIEGTEYAVLEAE